MSNAWMLRPNPHKIPRIGEFLSQDRIAVGWPLIGDLNGKPREQLKNILSKPPYNYASLVLGNAYGTLDIFVNRMNVNDLVLVPNGDDIHFCIIESDYIFESKYNNAQDGYPHQRAVRWLKTVRRKDLPMDLRLSLKAQQTATNLTRHYTTMEAFAYGKSLPSASAVSIVKASVSVDYPLRPDVIVTVTVPKDITITESERLGDFIKTLHFE